MLCVTDLVVMLDCHVHLGWAQQDGGRDERTFVFLSIYVILLRAVQDWNSNYDFNARFYHPDVSTYLLRGPDGPEAVELWSTSNFDSLTFSVEFGQSAHLELTSKSGDQKS